MMMMMMMMIYGARIKKQSIPGLINISSAK